MKLKRSEIKAINLTNIEPNPYQPRQVFEEQKIKGLAESIKQNGLLQKISVIPQVDENLKPITDKYFIVSGERRVRAYKYLAEEYGGIEFKAIEAVVIPVDELSPDTYKQKLMIDALLENVDREDLTPVEKAESLIKIKEETRKTYKEIAKMLGKSSQYLINIVSRYNRLTDVQKEKVRKERLGTTEIRRMLKKRSSSGKRAKASPQGAVRGAEGSEGDNQDKNITDDQTRDLGVEEALEIISRDIVRDVDKKSTEEIKFKKLDKFINYLIPSQEIEDKLDFINKYLDKIEEK